MEPPIIKVSHPFLKQGTNKFRGKNRSQINIKSSISQSPGDLSVSLDTGMIHWPKLG